MVESQKRKPESETPENGLFPRGELLALLCGIIMLLSFFVLPWFNTPLEVIFPEADANNPAYLIDVDGNVLETQHTPTLNEDGDIIIVNDRDRDFDFEGFAPFLLNDEGQSVTLAENGKFVAFRRLNADVTDANAYDEDNENPQPQLLNPNGEFVLFENNTVIVVPKIAGIGTAAVEDEGFVIYREVTAVSRFVSPLSDDGRYSTVELNTALLIPLMGVIAIGLALYSMAEPFNRRRSVIGMMITGGVALLYYGTHFQVSSDTCQVTVNGLGGGYWLSFFAAVGLILQGFIPRPRGHYSLTPRRGNLSVPAGQQLRPAMAIMYIILTLSAVAAIVPFLWMISTSFMTLGETLTGSFIPSQMQVCNYVEAWDEAQFGEYFINSVIITATVIIGLLVTSILSAYAFARIEFFGRNTIFTLLLITLMIPESVTMIPNFLIVSGNLFPLPQFGLETAALAGNAQTLNYIFG
ncbi:MAG: carbohydrate ABC transporter permease, partial [Aggregatilineales bacterium]